MNRYPAVAAVTPAASIAPTVTADPDDDAVFATALAARAELNVSVDKRVRAIQNYRGIEMVSAAKVLARIAA